jgi:hypothetical protein
MIAMAVYHVQAVRYDHLNSIQDRSNFRYSWFWNIACQITRVGLGVAAKSSLMCEKSVVRVRCAMRAAQWVHFPFPSSVTLHIDVVARGGSPEVVRLVACMHSCSSFAYVVSFA